MSRNKGSTNRRTRVTVRRTIAITTPLGDRRQYVNLTSGLPGSDARSGRQIIVKAQVTPAVQGVTVYWSLDSRANRQGLGRNERAGLVAFNNPNKWWPADTLTSVTDAQGVAQVWFRLSRYGGDEHRVRAGLAAGTMTTSSGWITVWRKLWYQLTRPQGVAHASLAPMEQAYQRVFIQIQQSNVVDYQAGWLNPLSIGHTNYYPLQMVAPGAANLTPIPVIGDFNKQHFSTQFVRDQGTVREHRKVHVIAIGAQYDENNNAMSYRNVIHANPIEIVMPRPVLNPALQVGTNWFVSGQYRPLGGAWLPLAAGDLAFPANPGAAAAVARERPRYVQVTLPLGLGAPPIAGGYDLELTLVGADGPYGGESFGVAQTMAVACGPHYGPLLPSTVAHEIGHKLNQSPLGGTVWTGATHPGGFGLPTHPHAYVGYGGQGPHCHTIRGGGVDGPNALVNDPVRGWIYPSNTGTCIMFHQAHPGCLNEFCTVCEPYLRAEAAETV